MVCEEKAEWVEKLSWIEADPAGQDAPISVWWDQPPAGEEDDGYPSKADLAGKLTTRTPRT
jgi:hypothetical protein